jgi:hypothetical protein
MTRSLFVLLSIVAGSIALAAEPPPGGALAGEDLFAQGRFAEAAPVYEKAAESECTVHGSTGYGVEYSGTTDSTRLLL